MRLIALLGALSLTATAYAAKSVKTVKTVKASFTEPALIGGRPADPQDWPASVYASMSGARCSATLVGPRVLFIAAHCVSDGGSASFSVGPNQYTSKCTHSSDYRRNNTADYALCVVDREVTGVAYENVATDPNIVKLGDEILLTGYGCIRAGGGGGNDGVYRIGEAKVRGLPAGTSNDITAGSGAALCFGDSGGPAFKYTDTAKTKRVMISINSRGDIKSTSYLSAVFTQQGKRFISAWQAQNPYKICGVDKDAVGCRDASEAPPPEGVDCKAQVDAFSKAKDALDKAYVSLVDCLSK